jgi:hypothetical protein
VAAGPPLFLSGITVSGRSEPTAESMTGPDEPRDPSEVPPRGPIIRRALTVLVVLLLAAAIALWVASPYWASRNSASSAGAFAVVSETNWHFFGSTACWTGEATGGVVLPAGSLWGTGVDLAYSLPANVTCVAGSVWVSTPGFGLLNDSAPTVVPGPGTGWLWVNVTVPRADFQGPLDLYVSVTAE